MVQLLRHAALAPAGFQFADAGRGILRALFGEIGDKTFFVVLVLTAWCPWEGPRSVDHTPAQRALVCSAGLLAVCAHAVIVSLIANDDWDAWCEGKNWAFETAGGCLLALLGLRAYLGSAGAASSPATSASGASAAERGGGAGAGAGAGPAGNPFGAAAEGEAAPGKGLEEKEQVYNQDAFRFPALPTACDGQAGGVGAAPEMTADGLLGVPPSGSCCSAAMAFLATVSCTFLAEAEDKSWFALVEGGRQGADLLIGAILGFVPAVLLASFLGYVMWCQLEPSAIRLAAIFVFLSLSLVSFSQALLHLQVLDADLATASDRAGHSRPPSSSQ